MNTYIIIENSKVTNKILAESTPTVKDTETVKLASNYSSSVNIGDIHDVSNDTFKEQLIGIPSLINVESFHNNTLQGITRFEFFGSSNTASVVYNHNINSIGIGDFSISNSTIDSVSTTNNKCNINFTIDPITGSNNPIEINQIGSITSPDISGEGKFSSKTFYYTSGSNPYSVDAADDPPL